MATMRIKDSNYEMIEALAVEETIKTRKPISAAEFLNYFLEIELSKKLKKQPVRKAKNKPT
jgi:hypothetical protein